MGKGKVTMKPSPSVNCLSQAAWGEGAHVTHGKVCAQVCIKVHRLHKTRSHRKAVLSVIPTATSSSLPNAACSLGLCGRMQPCRQRTVPRKPEDTMRGMLLMLCQTPAVPLPALCTSIACTQTLLWRCPSGYWFACNVGNLVWSLGWGDPLEKDMATCSSILAWRIPWTDEPGRLQSMGLQRVRHNGVTNTFTFKLLEWLQRE